MNKTKKIKIICGLLLILFTSYTHRIKAITRWVDDPTINTPFFTSAARENIIDVINDRNNNFLLIWSVGNSNGMNINKYEVTGNPLWAQPRTINVSPDIGPSHIRTAISNDNVLHLTWENLHYASTTNAYTKVMHYGITQNGDFIWESYLPITSNERSQEPSIDSDQNNNTYIAWSDTYTNRLFIQKFNANGQPQFVSENGLVLASGLQRRDPKVVSDMYGGAYIIWTQSDQQPIKYLIQHITKDGVKKFGNLGITISDKVTANDENYNLISDGVGGVIVSWFKFSGENPGWYIERFNENGQKLFLAPIYLHNISNPIVKLSTDNKLLMVWNKLVPTENKFDIYTQKYNLDGQKIWSDTDVPVIEYDKNQLLGDVTTLPDGGAYIVWEDQRNGVLLQDPIWPEKDLYAQRIDNNGQKLWNDEGVPISIALHFQNTPHSITDQQEGLIVFWDDYRNSTLFDQHDIYAQRVNPDGTLGGPVEETPTPTSEPPTATPTPEPCLLTQYPDLVSQNDPQWGSDSYGGTYQANTYIPFKYYSLNSSSTIADSIDTWGCNLTSHVMNINYYAQLQNVNVPGTDTIFQTTPKILNDWLQRNNGYYTGKIMTLNDGSKYVNSSFVVYGAVERYAKKNNVKLSYEAPIKYSMFKPPLTGSDFTARYAEGLTRSLCSLQPAILMVQWPGFPVGHYVSATGKSVVNTIDTWRIHDPERTYVTSLQEKYQNIFWGIQKVKTEVPQEFLSFALHSPVEIVVTDPDGKKQGFNPLTQTFFNEINEAYYDTDLLASVEEGFSGSIEQKLLQIGKPKAGIYSIDVFGTGNGDYALETVYSLGDIVHKLPIVSGAIASGDLHTYILQFNSNSENSVLIRSLPVSFEMYGKPGELPIAGKLQAVISGSQTLSVKEIDLASVQFVNIVDFLQPINTSKIIDLNNDMYPDLLTRTVINKPKFSSIDPYWCIVGNFADGAPFQGCGIPKMQTGVKI
jgi:hypothetical protein